MTVPHSAFIAAHGPGRPAPGGAAAWHAWSTQNRLLVAPAAIERVAATVGRLPHAKPSASHVVFWHGAAAVRRPLAHQRRLAIGAMQHAAAPSGYRRTLRARCSCAAGRRHTCRCARCRPRRPRICRRRPRRRRRRRWRRNDPAALHAWRGVAQAWPPTSQILPGRHTPQLIRAATVRDHAAHDAGGFARRGLHAGASEASSGCELRRVPASAIGRVAASRIDRCTDRSPRTGRAWCSDSHARSLQAIDIDGRTPAIAPMRAYHAGPTLGPHRARMKAAAVPRGYAIARSHR